MRYLSVLAAAVAAYGLALGGSFVGWDDSLVTGKLALRGFSAEHLLGILVPVGGSYQPVRDLALALTYHFSGLDPFGYLLVNFLLYLLTIALAFRVLESLEESLGDKEKSAVPGLIPWIGAALFALHPLHVEAVAWIQGNKDLLASVFCLGAFLCYLEFRKRTGPAAIWVYLSTYALFLLALGSKPSAAAFPLLILAFDIIGVRRAGQETDRAPLDTVSRLIARHLPYWIPAALLAGYFIFFTAAVKPEALTWENFLLLPRVLWSYYHLMLLPVGLMNRYPDPLFHGPGDPALLAGSIITALVIFLAVLRMRRHRLAAFGAVWFYLCWLPQSGLVPIAIRVADRYIFLSLLGACLAAACGISALAHACREKTCRRSLFTCTVLVLGLLGSLSARRCLVWRDGVTLWSDAVAKRPHMGYYYKALGNVYLDVGDTDKAFSTFTRAAERSPKDPAVWNNMGYLRQEQGRYKEALALYSRALALDSLHFNACNSTGNIHARSGNDSLAVAYYFRAMNISPDNYMVRSNLATLYRRMGRKEKADSLMTSLEAGPLPQPVILLKRGREFIAEGKLDSARLRLERALAIDKGLTVAQVILGEILLRQDSAQQALDNFRTGYLSAVPDYPLLTNMALAFERQGLDDSASVYYRKAHVLEPDSLQTALNLAVSLNRLDRTDEAVRLLEEMLKKHPGHFMANFNLANWLVKQGRLGEAALHYRRAVRENPGHANSHLNLGLVCFKLGDRQAALEHLRTCLELEPDHPQAPSIRSTIEHFQERR
ncbi:MAG: tetratricopeptide repeat protein [Gemmatimonadota bacterium]|nr:tetratricopeptide repeat protein [Gemmatimonadota bacterium]